MAADAAATTAEEAKIFALVAADVARAVDDREVAALLIAGTLVTIDDDDVRARACGCREECTECDEEFECWS